MINKGDITLDYDDVYRYIKRIYKTIDEYYYDYKEIGGYFKTEMTFNKSDFFNEKHPMITDIFRE